MKRAKKHPLLLTRENALALAIFLVCWLLCLWLMKPNVNLLTPEGFKQGIKNFGFLAPLVYIWDARWGDQQSRL